jgi:hypothetical protein
MPDLHAAAPDETHDGPAPRPATFGRLVRANLPGPADLVIYAAITAALCLLWHFTVPAAIAATVLAATARLVILATVDYVAARRSVEITWPDDDGTGGGDG